MSKIAHILILLLNQPTIQFCSFIYQNLATLNTSTINVCDMIFRISCLQDDMKLNWLQFLNNVPEVDQTDICVCYCGGHYDIQF